LTCQNKAKWNHWKQCLVAVLKDTYVNESVPMKLASEFQVTIRAGTARQEISQVYLLFNKQVLPYKVHALSSIPVAAC